MCFFLCPGVWFARSCMCADRGQCKQETVGIFTGVETGVGSSVRPRDWQQEPYQNRHRKCHQDQSHIDNDPADQQCMHRLDRATIGFNVADCAKVGVSVTDRAKQRRDQTRRQKINLSEVDSVIAENQKKNSIQVGPQSKESTS